MDVVRICKHDETYFKILCDPGILTEISEHFTFEVPGAKFSPAYKNRMPLIITESLVAIKMW